MRGYHAKVDANQSSIVAALRKAGASVQLLHSVGQGCPDLIVGWQSAEGVRELCFVEVKDGAKPPSKRALTEDQEDWFEQWKGKAPVIVTSEAEALAVIGVEVAK